MRGPAHARGAAAGGRAGPIRAALAASLALGAACAERDPRQELALAELERLAFVPAAECIFAAPSVPPLVCSNGAALLVDRFEVRRGDWRRWYLAQGGRDPWFEAEIARWEPGSEDWPAAFMDLAEARRYAASRGMRLLTAREWVRIAAGPRLLAWPSGQNREAAANTLELGLGRPVPVGTFEPGRSPLGVYDLIGNVWEWVEDPILYPYTLAAPGFERAMGGSWLARKRRIHDIVETSERKYWAFREQELDARARAIDVGLRCAAVAGEWLWTHAPGWRASGDARERLVAVGAAWGRDALPLLDELCARPEAPRSLAALREGARR